MQSIWLQYVLIDISYSEKTAINDSLVNYKNWNEFDNFIVINMLYYIILCILERQCSIFYLGNGNFRRGKYTVWAQYVHVPGISTTLIYLDWQYSIFHLGNGNFRRGNIYYMITSTYTWYVTHLNYTKVNYDSLVNNLYNCIWSFCTNRYSILYIHE